MDEKLIKDAQYRKGLSIAFFNATNAAIELVKNSKVVGANIEEIEFIAKTKIIMWRDFFLEEHKNYYATVIANVGVNYRASETIEKLRACTTKIELAKQWQAISEDERRDGEIRKVVKELKETLK